MQKGIFVSTPNADGAGIWAGGSGPAIDAIHNVYLSTSNGKFDVSQGGMDYSDSVLKRLPNVLSVQDFFAPENEAMLEAHDSDLGSGGVMILPDQVTSPAHLMVTVGKEGRVFLINRDNLGKFNCTVNGVVQQQVAIHGLFGPPTFWNNTLYFITVEDKPRAFSFNNGRIASSPSSQASVTYPFPGAVPVVSANGHINGILWAVQQSGAASSNDVFHAYDATNLANELYNSDQAGTRDVPGTVGIPFQSISVANSKIYVPTGLPQLTVFGLLPGH